MSGRVSGLVASRASAFAVALGACFVVVTVSSTRHLAGVIGATSLMASPTARTVLTLIAIGFAAVTLVVAGSVLANATATRIAEEAPQIALRRLLGSSATAERGRLMRGAVTDSVLGIVVGAALGLLGAWSLTGSGADPAASAPSLVGVLVVAVASAWRGSAAVCQVSPVQALGAAEQQYAGRGDLPEWSGGALALLVGGASLLVLGALAGSTSPYGVVPALLGAILLLLGIVVSAPALIPRWLRLLHRAVPRSLAATVAARRLEEHPERTARTGIGILVSVGVVTMFVVATASVDQTLRRAYEGTSLSDVAGDLLDPMLATVVPLVALIAVISAVGLIDTVLAESRLRARETALLRVLGQERRDVVAEALHAAALQAFGSAVLGVAVGTLVGWVGAQSLLGSIAGLTVVSLVLPWSYLLAVGLGAFAVTLVATVVPLRLRLAESPIVAYRAT